MTNQFGQIHNVVQSIAWPMALRMA